MSHFTRAILVAAMLGVLAIPANAAGQQQKDVAYPYIAIDVGTLGGPSTHFGIPGQVVTTDGTVLVQADATTPDTDSSNTNPLLFGHDTYISHAALWHKNVLTDLGALPGSNDSAIFVVNGRGVGAGEAENGIVDPLTGFTEVRAVLFSDGHVANLDTASLGGPESFAAWINNRDQIVGFATNTIPDPFALDTWANEGTQMHAVLWQDGQMHDLGTLGGPDSAADYVNNRGQVAGNSFTTATVNPATGIPTEHPFLWQNGHMQDLGTLGGTRAYPSAGGSNALNDRGEVVGLSTLQGDQVNHPFLWDGHVMKDLGTFGGNFGEAHSLNQAGDVVGYAATPDGNAHAFLWKNGVLTDLDGATSLQCHFANSINARDQVVGGSCGANADGWLWEHGTLSDLNTLVAPSASHLQLTEAHYINDRGEIAVMGVLPNGDQRVVLLVPNCQSDSNANNNCDNGDRMAALVHNYPETATTNSTSLTYGDSRHSTIETSVRSLLTRRQYGRAG